MKSQAELYIDVRQGSPIAGDLVVGYGLINRVQAQWFRNKCEYTPWKLWRMRYNARSDFAMWSFVCAN